MKRVYFTNPQTLSNVRVIKITLAYKRWFINGASIKTIYSYVGERISTDSLSHVNLSNRNLAKQHRGSIYVFQIKSIWDNQGAVDICR